MPAKRIGERVVFGSEMAKDCMVMFWISQCGRKVDDLEILTVPKKKQWDAVYILRTPMKIARYRQTPYKTVMYNGRKR